MNDMAEMVGGGLLSGSNKNCEDSAPRRPDSWTDASVDVTTSRVRDRPNASTEVANTASDYTNRPAVLGADHPSSAQQLPQTPTRRSGRSSTRPADELSRALSSGSVTDIVEAYFRRNISMPKMARRARSSSATTVEGGNNDDGPSVHSERNVESVDDDSDVIYV